MTNRKQFVNFQGTESLTEYVTCGVLQGSILGLLLFLVYINDLPKVTNKLFPILFADDTTLLIEGSNIHDIITTLNNELNRLNVWLGANKLSINVSKTHLFSHILFIVLYGALLLTFIYSHSLCYKRKNFD